MKNTTLTQENLQAIYTAMQVIAENDRSDLFKNYYCEVVGMLVEQMKLDEIENLKKETNEK